MRKGYQDTIDWYNTHAEEFSSRAGGSNYGLMEVFEKYLPEGGKVLDGGCGSGRDTESFRQHGFDVTGLDVSDGLIHEAKKTYPESKFLVGDIRSLPFPEEDFDGIWANASLLHFETREDVLGSLREFFRVLKDKGILYVSVKLQTGDEKTGLEEDKRFAEARFFQYFTEDEMKELLHEAGFAIESSRVEQSKSRENVVWIQIFGKKRME